MLSYVDAFQSSSKDSSFTTGNIPLFAQCLLMSLLMFILTKQIPQMVQGLPKCGVKPLPSGMGI